MLYPYYVMLWGGFGCMQTPLSQPNLLHANKTQRLHVHDDSDAVRKSTPIVQTTPGHDVRIPLQGSTSAPLLIIRHRVTRHGLAKADSSMEMGVVYDWGMRELCPEPVEAVLVVKGLISMDWSHGFGDFQGHRSPVVIREHSNDSKHYLVPKRSCRLRWESHLN